MKFGSSVQNNPLSQINALIAMKSSAKQYKQTTEPTNPAAVLSATPKKHLKNLKKKKN